MSLSFFQPRASGLHALHPLTKLTAVFAILLIGFLARWPHLPIALFVFAVLPLAVWGRIARAVVRATMTVFVPLLVSLVLVQGLFYPGASQVIFSIGPLAFKLEGLLFAYATASRILLLAGAGTLLLYSTHPADLTLALQQRGLPSGLAYVVVTAIQLLPQMQARAASILDAQRSRGLETEGALMNRVRALIPLLGPLVTSALTDVDERAMALEVRAFSSPRRKTSFRELCDSHAQMVARRLLLAMTALVGALELIRPV